MTLLERLDKMEDFVHLRVHDANIANDADFIDIEPTVFDGLPRA
jgi:hypothetical protein